MQTSAYSTDTIVKFTIDTAVAGLIQDDEEAADSSEVKGLNISRIKEVKVDVRGKERSAQHTLTAPDKWDQGGDREQLQVLGCANLRGPDVDHPHYYSGKEGKAASVSS